MAAFLGPDMQRVSVIYLRLSSSHLHFLLNFKARGRSQIIITIIVNEWEKRATDFILGIINHLWMVIQNQINIIIISFCLGKRDIGTGSGPLYPWLWVLVNCNELCRNRLQSYFKYV